MSQQALEVPVGAIVATVQSLKSLPPGWLPCDGSVIDDQYTELITMLGATVTPNLIGRTLIGAGNLAAAASDQADGRAPAFGVLGEALQIGSTGGECQHVLSVAEMPAHGHTINGGDFGLHSRSFVGSDDSDIPYETHADIGIGGGTDNAGQGAAHYNVQPYFSVTYLIYAGTV